MITNAALDKYNGIIARFKAKLDELREAGRAVPPETEIDGWLASRRRAHLQQIAAVLAETQQSLPDVPEDWTPARRRDANLAAMRLLASKAPSAMTVEDRVIVSGYSGYGGLSLKEVSSDIPPSLELDPESLIHEYYTPFKICLEVARVMQPLLERIKGTDGVLRVLEPSAGIGRFPRAFDMLPAKPPMRWTCIELSSVAARMLAAVRPGTEVVASSFESWVSKNNKPFNLIVANPPFGERGRHKGEDPNREYREDQAAAYFVRRGLDVLVPNGLAAFIIPTGYLSDKRRDKWREKVLLKHHLLAAFRLPSHVRQDNGTLRALFPGTHNVVDLLFFQRRPGELAEVDPADRFILEGRYFEEIMGHVLGVADTSAQQLKIIGPPVRLPPLLARPMCEVCRIRVVTPVEDDDAAEVSVGEDPKVETARALGERVRVYLDDLAAGTDVALRWPELHAGLLDWSRAHGSPYMGTNLRQLAHATNFLKAWSPDGRLIPGLSSPPTVQSSKLETLRDPVALAYYLWTQERGLTLARLIGVLQDQGQEAARGPILERLYAAGWCVDGLGLSQLVPRDAYLSGDLWKRLEHLARAPEHPRREIQERMLREKIPPVLFSDLGEIQPRLAWIPEALIDAFATEVLTDNRALKLSRRQGVVAPKAIEYDEIEHDDKRFSSAEAVAFLGWLNHDLAIFKPKRQEGRSTLEERELRAAKWTADFQEWLAKDESRMRQMVDAYTRTFRGFIPPKFSTDPLAIARWTNDPSRQLFDYQRAGVRRIVENRGGILSYDVGVGKTFTALGAVAVLKQEGICKRVIIMVPNSLVFQWLAEIRRVLPDYKVGIIGAKLITRKRGEKAGKLDSAGDTPQERAAKWARFQAGEFDLVLMTYTAMPRTRIDAEKATEVFNTFGALAREVRFRRRSINRKDPDKLTEREEAIKAAKTEGWVEDKLELPPRWEYDGDVVWDALGCDFLVVDEFHNFKNLFMPDERERGLPAFMGSGGEGSARAWHLFFRAVAVRQAGGGILGLTATPAKNGPTELFSAFSIIDPKIWADYGISDTEQFIDQFCQLEVRPVVNTAMEIEERQAMVGFINLPDLRSILTRHIEFMSAREAADAGKIKKPKASQELVRVDQDAVQRRKLGEILEATRERVKLQLGNVSSTVLEEAGLADKSGDKSPKITEQKKPPDLGAIARMGLIAIHGQLDEGYTLDSAVAGGRGKDNQTLPPPDSFHSPKFDAVAQNIVANSSCGHIVFLEPKTAQAWLREVLVEAGVPRERIVLLNRETAPSAQDRLRIADEFNEGKYLVVIANSVAGEGANLQRRTCAVHNVDIPWDPMTRRQRNGRADRQGNELSAVTIYDYLTRNSGDGPRFDKLRGKGTWIEQVLQSKDDVAINPAAQVSLSPIELLADLTNDPAEARRLLEQIEERERLKRMLRVRSKIARILRAVNDRFRAAEASTDPEVAAGLRGDGARMLTDMENFDPETWPFIDLARRVVDTPIAVTEEALPLWEGLRLVRGDDAIEIGRVENGGYAFRRAGSYSWKVQERKSLGKFPLFEPADYFRPWPDEAQLDLSDRLRVIKDFDTFASLNWSWASDAWITETWKKYGPILGRMNIGDVPARSREGELYIAHGRGLTSLEVLPPSREGWQEFVTLASAGDYDRNTLEDMARKWWGRSLRGRKAETNSAALGTLAAKREAVRRATSELLRHRGLTVSTGEGLHGELVVMLNDKRFRLPPGALLSRHELPPAMPALEAAAYEAVGDVLTLVDQARAEHGERAYAMIAEKMAAAPEQFDSQFALEEAPFEATKPTKSASTDVEAILDETLDALGGTFTVQALAHEAGERHVLLRSRRAWDVLDSVPEGTPLVNLALVFERGLAADDFDFSPLRAAWPQLRRPRAQYQSITERVMQSVAAAASQVWPMDEKALLRSRVAREGRFRVTSSYHRKEKRYVWVVSVVIRVPDDEFGRLRSLAARYGGTYSYYKTTTVPSGFQFWVESDAWAFVKDATMRVHNAGTSTAGGVTSTAASTAAVTSTAAASVPAKDAGHVYRIGDQWFGDSALVQAFGRKYIINHAGYGFFDAEVPGGKIDFNLYTDERRFEDQSGRLHTLLPHGDIDLEALLDDLISNGLAVFGGRWNDWPFRSETASAPAGGGNHWIVGGRVYGDTALVKSLTGRFPFERPHTDVVSVRLPRIALMLRHTRDDSILPSQQGPLYEVTGQGDVQAALSQLWRDGVSEFRGSFSDWPTKTGAQP